jgi:DNA adenine methylase
MKSFLRWAGSKKQIVAHLAPHYPSAGGKYLEPFAGSACLFFHLEPDRAVLGDINWELISALQTIQRQPRRVLRVIAELPTGESAYYAIRSLDPHSLSSIERAARFLYLNHYCFNGLYRTNERGIFNVPYGPPKNGAEVDEALLLRASLVLKRATVVHGDFEETLEHARRGDFVYLDPPYVVDSRRVFSEYGSGSFSSKDLDRLGTALADLDRRQVTFLISYADSAEARRLLSRWNPRRIRTRRNIAGFVGSRRFSYELLATNSEAVTK